MPWTQLNINEETDKLLRKFQLDENITQKQEAINKILSEYLNGRYK